MVGESWDSWKDSVKKTIEMDPDSVTIYQMELPYNTVYSRRVLDNDPELAFADWETKRAWHDYAFEQLAGAGFEPSSSYTMVKRGPHGRFVYRDAVWRGCDLIGAGVASFSHVGGVHFQNESGWEPYLGRVEGGELPVARAFATVETERLTRETILQLKLGQLDTEYFREKFGVDILSRFSAPLKRLADRDMLELADGSVRLTRQGLLRVDSLLPEFYADTYRGSRYT
jgi:oxygen-independent coproporphyrinogen-3 oxidase